MHKPAIALVIAFFAAAATAQQPLQCLNPDVLNGLVFLGRSELKVEVTRSLPPAMSGLRAPDAFSLIGTGVRDSGRITNVAYKTALTIDKAYTDIVAALGSAGWAVEASAAAGTTFNVAGAPRTTSVCRNGDRRAVMVAEVAGVRYVNIIGYAQGEQPRDCNAPDPGPGNLAFMTARNAVPRFRFPAGTAIAQGGGGGGGGSDVFTSATRIISSESATALAELLASQLQGQGWRPDSVWSGAGSAGSTWRKLDEGRLTWGTLEIVRVSERTYDVDFTLALSSQ